MAEGLNSFVSQIQEPECICCLKHLSIEWSFFICSLIESLTKSCLAACFHARGRQIHNISAVHHPTMALAHKTQ